MKQENNNLSKPLFTMVEVEVNSRCNKRCLYCPTSINPEPETPLFMSDAIFYKLIEELIQMKFSGRISYSLYSEPLLRTDLERLISYVKSKLPDVYQLLFTNGDFLTDERYNSLKKAGINHFLVTRHDFTPIPERPMQTVQFPADLVLNNRGGVIFKIDKSLHRPCYAPSEMLVVTCEGDILLCCNDGARRTVMGNICRKQLREIWFSKKYDDVRKSLEKGDRFNASQICRYCNSIKFFTPGEDFNNPKHWLKENE